MAFAGCAGLGCGSEPPGAIELVFEGPMLMGARGERLPAHCSVVRRSGEPYDLDPLVSSALGMVEGQRCSELRFARSGVDTLQLSAAGYTRTVTVAVAVRPELLGPVPETPEIDGLPPLIVWSPSGRLVDGTVELYLSLYPIGPDGNAVYGADLVRLVSSDGGARFRYDGVALRHDAEDCSYTGSGIECVAFAPRSDGPGERMFFSAGSFTCYGWQVFSATSTDGRSWTPEPGIRIPNRGPEPFEPPDAPPWPVGEGLQVDQLESGEWRMLVGGRVALPGSVRPDFEIVEWRSADQLSWSYHREHLTVETLGIPPGTSIYSPNLRRVGPGLYRMIFAASSSSIVGAPTHIRSAVSTDGERWLSEAVLYARPDVQTYYASWVGDRVYFVERPVAAPQREYRLRSIRLAD